MAADHHVNFAIRPNKTVQRKLVFETLALLNQVYDFGQYRYIGFGAVWFLDFVLAHKYLCIDEMISIEEDEYLVSRARFNRPFACVQVLHGSSDTVLPTIQLDEKELLVWLDYNKSIDGTVLPDLTTLCQRAMTGSLLMVTINASKNGLPNKDPEDREFSDDQERLRFFAGDLIPSKLPRGALQGSGYPHFLASILFMHMRRQLRKAGREKDRIVPIFNIRYQDNAPMLTVGAAIAEAKLAEKTATVLEKTIAGRMNENDQLSIRVPPLTLKEKATIDQLMPCDPAPSESNVQELGFRLAERDIEAYHRFYRYYPMFGEVTI